MKLYNKLEENEEDPKIIGVIYALPSNILERVFHEKKNIFVKYMPFEPNKKSKIKLYEGMKLYLYETKADKEIIGEATVDEILFQNLKGIVDSYLDKLMLSKQELEKYCRGRYAKKAMIFILKKVKKYKKPIRININITMGGLYVTEDNKRRLNLQETS